MRNDTMSFTHWTACAALAATLTASSAAAQNEQTQYHVAGPAGVTIRNVRDNAGIPVGKFGTGTVLYVHEAMGEWTQVEPAGGLTCWVLGAYLEETGTSGRYSVKGDGVNMRPLASAGNGSFPMMQRLYTGDLVRMVSRNDPNAPFAEDWIQIRTPKGVHGWALTNTMQPAPDPAQASATWAGEWSEILKGMGVPEDPAATSAKGEATAPDSDDQSDLVRARRMMDESPPRYAEAKALYSDILAKAPSGSPVATAARSGLFKAEAYESIETLERELEMERMAREARETERQNELDRLRNEDSPLMGRYDARGWMESRRMPNGEPAWYLRFGGKDACRVWCTSGRYDLTMFDGYEVGVTGLMTNEAGGAQTACDMRSIEVLSGRANR